MRSGLSPELVQTLLNEGMTQSEIAREFGVSRQYVNKLLKDTGRESPITVVSENLPWEVSPEYYDSVIYANLRIAAHYNLTNGEDLVNSSLVKVRALTRKLLGFRMVVDYDPSYPAIPGVTATPGFAYLPRAEADEDYMIKIRPGVRLTETGKKIWRIPEIDLQR